MRMPGTNPIRARPEPGGLGDILDRLRDEPGLDPEEREGASSTEWSNASTAMRSSPRSGVGWETSEGRMQRRSCSSSRRSGAGSLYDDLAEALLGQPDLPAERAWEALAILDTSGRLDQFPALLERWDDLVEAIDEGSLGDLARQLEEGPDGSWLALQGLGAVEPEVRTEIIAGLAEQGGGPGLVEFLRLLTFAHDPATRRAALDALDQQPRDEPAVADAWRSIARAHPDLGVVERASRRSEGAVKVTCPPSANRQCSCGAS